jgi:hypothetical protein
MISVEQLLSLYCNEPKDFDKSHAAVISQYRTTVKSQYQNIRVESVDQGVYGFILFMGRVNHKTNMLEIVEYVPDIEITRHTSSTMKAPLNNITDSNFAYYGLKLNMLANLAKANVVKLSIVHSKEGIVVPVQRVPAIADVVLGHYVANHRGKVLGVKEKKVAIQYAMAI